MSLQSVSSVSELQVQERNSRRKDVRYPFTQAVDWDFFTAPDGLKRGYLENVSASGCLLRTTEPIEHRRWIRLVIKDAASSTYFTAVGRACRREDRLEGRDDQEVTLHRYGIEFIQSLNPMALESIRRHSCICAQCGGPGASIQDAQDAAKIYCVLCHLRKACHALLLQEGLSGS
jgi:hypothetical protein